MWTVVNARQVAAVDAWTKLSALLNVATPHHLHPHVKQMMSRSRIANFSLLTSLTIVIFLTPKRCS